MAPPLTSDAFITANDGRILNVINSDLGNNITRYTYLDWANLGFRLGSIHHIITATTLTIEGANIGYVVGDTISETATATDGTGATLTCSRLNTTNGFVADTDLVGLQVRITEDATTPANVGLKRTIITYTGATGACALDTAIGAITSGVTKFVLEDHPNPWMRRVSDPTGTQWRDVTTLLTGAASHTATGIWVIDTPIDIERFRIKRVTTNATNALALRVSRGR